MRLRLETVSARGDLGLFRDDVEQFQLKYRNKTFSDAYASCHDQYIEIKSKNFRKREFDVFKNEEKCGYLTFSWFSCVIISLVRVDGSENDTFLLRKRGFLNPYYELVDVKGHRILTLKDNYHWNDFKYYFSVDNETHEFPDTVLDEFLIYCGFAVNLRSKL